MSEITIKLEDSWLLPTPATTWWDCKRYGASTILAIDNLNANVHSSRLQCYSLNGAKRDEFLPDLIGFRATQMTSKGNKTYFDEIKFTTSHYVGQACVVVDDNTIRFRIEPRMAKPIWRYMLKSSARVYLPESLHSLGMESDADDTEWLLLLMWRNAFERAMKLVSVPKAYVWRHSNLRCFKGRLDVPRHLMSNLTDQSRFYCSYKPLTFDNTINRTIRMVYRLLLNSTLPVKAYLSIAEHDARLASFGVGNEGVSLRDIDSISYTRHTEPYRAVMNLSKLILRGYGAGEVEGAGKGPAYFVDVAEIWENYLLSVFQKRISEYRFVSPNEQNRNDWLLENARRVRPDFLVYGKDGELIAIMDAKYKKVDRIGTTAKDSGAVSREDLYQMATYLYRYGDPEKEIAGIFLTPYSENENSDLHPMAWKSARAIHYMGVCGFPMQRLEKKYPNYATIAWSTNEGRQAHRSMMVDFYKMEEDFCNQVRSMLNTIVANRLAQHHQTVDRDRSPRLA